jgi:acyl-CoA thioester hydrolase
VSGAPRGAPVADAKDGDGRSRIVPVELRVRYAETDQMGVVYHSHYLVWCEIGRTEYIRTVGATYAAIEQSGVLLAVAEATLRYHASARYDERIRVETTLDAVRSRSLTFSYAIVNADSGARLCSASTVLVALGSSGRPMILPADVRTRLAEFAAGR